MKVQIFSMMAALCGGEHGAQWEGEVPSAYLRFGNNPQDDPEIAAAINEDIYRLFNRIDEADNTRLEHWGYMLPSLSVGDFVTWGGKTYGVAALGFQTATGSENDAAEFIRRNHSYSTE